MTERDIDFLNMDALQLIGGATLAVSVIANTVQALTKRRSPWIAFLASVLVITAIGLATDGFARVTDVLLAIANVCLLFCTASGIQGLAVHVTTPRGDSPAKEEPDSTVRASQRPRRPFLLQSWFRSV